MRPVDPRVLPHLAPARRALAGVVAANLAGGLLQVGQAFAVAGIAAGLLDGSGAGRSAVWLAAITAARGLVSWLGDLLSARAATQVGVAMRRRLLDAALRLGPLALSRRRAGEVALLATRGVAAVEPYLTRYLPTLVVAATLPALTVVAIAWLDWVSALIVVLTLPLVPIFAVLIGLTTKDRADRQWRLLSRLSGHFLDVMRGLPTLVAYRRAEAQSASIRLITHRYRQATRETLRLGFASSAALELIATISVALVAVSVGLRLASGSLGLHTALVVLLLAPEAYWPLRRVGAEFHAAAEGTATFEEADRLLADAPPVVEERACERLETTGTGVPVRLRNLTFGYPGRDMPVLDNFSATIPARGVTAVVGPSGAGKSTLLGVLSGQLAPSAGTIHVGGVPLTADRMGCWQRRLAWMPQRPWVAAGSIAQNVRLGRPDATDADVWAALDRVALAAVVASLPDGLQTQLGEDGEGLSAGQRARLVLARAVLADRPVTLLDEPTAHLDPETEQVVLDTLRWLGQRGSVVVVAHRRAVVDLADTVVAVPARPSAEVVSRRSLGSLLHHREGSLLHHRDRSVLDHREPDHEAPVDPRRGLLLGTTLGALAAASGVALTATAGWLIARAAEHPPVLMLMVAIVGVRLFGLARPALRYAERLISHDIALALLAERRAEVFDRLVPLVPGRLGRQRGDVLTSVVDDVDSLLDHELRVRTPVATAVLVSTLAAGFAAWSLPAAGLVVLLVASVGGGLAWSLARSGVRRAEPAYVRGRAGLSALVVQTLQGAPDLTLWQAAPRRLDELDEAGRATGRATTSSAAATGAGRAAATWSAGAGVLAVAGVGAPALDAGSLSGPTLALLLLLPLALADVLAPLADAGALAVRTAAADRRLARLTGMSPAVSDPVSPVPLPPGRPAVAVREVAAGWGPEPAFRELSLDLRPGSRIGVVGPSGCGKSTLAAVLLRFLDPTAGTVTLEGVPTDRVALADVRSRVGLVDDDPHVFGSTLRENLRLARPDATDGEIVGALSTVSLGAWAAALPDGLDTQLGDGGALVSGGERARLGLARAVLADQPVLVLDEPTAHLDSATARAVTDDVLADEVRSVVWITHGTAGLDRMDAVLDLGAHPHRDREPATGGALSAAAAPQRR